MRTKARRSRRGFTLVEILVVLAVLGILAALLFSVYAGVRKRSYATVCASNLKQLGAAIALYQQDNDDLFPRGGDPTDIHTDLWQTAADGKYESEADSLPPLTYVLAPYLKSRTTWRCPADVGFDVGDISRQPLDARPSSYQRFGMSYYYRTKLTLERRRGLTAYFAHAPFTEYGPDSINVLADGHGGWHGEEGGQWRYNVLFADGHVKNVTSREFRWAWRLKLDPPDQAPASSAPTQE